MKFVAIFIRWLFLCADKNYFICYSVLRHGWKSFLEILFMG
jgi:hypothetical protein